MFNDRVPNLCRHSGTQQGYVTLQGREHYLGSWPAGQRRPPSDVRARYEALISRWLAHGRHLPDSGAGLSVNEVILAHLKWARVYYHRDGKPETHFGMIRDALQVVKDLFGRTPAAEFGPKKLKEVQQAMARKGWSRNYVNEQFNRVRRAFRWAVGEELVPSDLYHALQAVPGLRKGTPGVRETQPVKPVPEELVTAALPFMPPPVRAMVRLQLLTGMRPGEVCIMRPCDIDMSGTVWLYRPGEHKTEHHGHERVVPVGPRAQEIIRPWLKLDTQAY